MIVNPNIPTKKEHSINTGIKTVNSIKKKYTRAKRVKSLNKNFDSMRSAMNSAVNSTILTPIFVMLIINKVRNGENTSRLSSNETKKKNKVITTQTRLARKSVTKLENRIHKVKSARLIRDRYDLHLSDK